MSERRKNLRFEVPTERAQVLVDAGTGRAPAIMADMSANGFGLLALRGIAAEPGQSMKVITPDATYECEVISNAPDDFYQRIGLRRLTEEFELPPPIIGLPRSWFNDSMATFNPLLFVGVVLGFSGIVIGALAMLGIGPNEGPYGGPDSGRASRPLADAARDARETTNSLADRLARQKSQAATLITGSSDASWTVLVKKLDLTPAQQSQLLNLANEASSLSGRPSAQSIGLRQQALEALSAEQRRQVIRMSRGF